MTFQTVVGGSDDFRRLNEDRGLEPVLSPATVHRPGFIPALVLPGRDQHVLQEGLKAFSKRSRVLDGFRWSSSAPTAARSVATRKGCQ